MEKDIYKDQIEEREIQEIEDAAEDFELEDNNFKYIAFISYRHLEPDTAVAQKIHTMIETFKLPKEFVVHGKSPKFRVFRDREELPTSSLSDSIEEALRLSKFLIVICSKRLPESEWCNREVETFINLHGVERVIPVLVEGEPYESFPEALLNNETEVVLDDGSVVIENKDILAAELRPEEVLSPEFVGYEKLSASNPTKVTELANESKKLLKNEIYRIMAAILGVSYGDLKQRDKARKQRQMLIISSIVSLSLLFFGVFMFNAYRAENIAKRQTIQDRSQFMLDESNELLLEGDRFQALETSQNAMSDLDDKMENYNNLKSEHFQILNNAINITESTFNKVINTNNQFTFLDIDNDSNNFVVGMDNDSVSLFNMETGNELERFSGHNQQVKLVEYGNEKNIFASGGFDDVINVWDLETNELLNSVKTPGNVMLMNFSSDDEYLEVIYDTIENYIYQRYSVETLEEVGSPIYLRNGIKRVAFDNQNENMWIIYSSTLEDSSLISYNLETYEQIPFEDQLTEDLLNLDLGLDEDTDNEETDNFSKTPYKDFRISSDRNYLYLLSDSNIHKLNLQTREIEYTINEVFSSMIDDLLISEDINNQKLYIPNGTQVKKFDSNTGEFEKELVIGNESLIDIDISSENNILSVLGEKGTITIIQNDEILEQVPNLNNSNLEYISISSDGNYLLTLSLTDKEVKILEILSNDKRNIINGQIAGVSKNNNYTLFFESGKYFLWDNVLNEISSDIENQVFNSEVLTLADGQGYIVSDDGTKIAGVSKDAEMEFVDNAEVFVYDRESDEVIYKIPAPMNSFYYGFSQDGSYLIITSSFNEVTIYSVEDQSEYKKIIVDNGIINGISISNDNKYLVVNYSEGISTVYNIETDEKIGEINGRILNIESDETINIVSVYNNIGTKYEDFEVVQEVVLSPARDEIGSSINDKNYYNKEKNLLLTIKTQGENNYCYLVDFSTGDLIKSFVIPIRGYSAKGYISPSGENVYLDNSYNTFYDENENFNVYSKSIVFPIKSYDELYSESIEVLENIK